MSDHDPVMHDRQRLFGLSFASFARIDDVMHMIEGVDLSATDRFRYVVTPNADHIVRLKQAPTLRKIYNGAWLCLNDSRVIQLLLRLGGTNLPAIRGSDLALELLTSQWIEDKRVIVIGGDERVSQRLNSLCKAEMVFHYNPPLGFIRSKEAIGKVVDFIESHLPAVVFLAVGSPNQEIVADACVRRGLRHGIAFCIGAAILMAAGVERRAPPAVQFAGLEWLYRLARDPRRLASRYLRDVKILPIVAREIIRRRSL